MNNTSQNLLHAYCNSQQDREEKQQISNLAKQLNDSNRNYTCSTEEKTTKSQVNQDKENVLRHM